MGIRNPNEHLNSQLLDELQFYHVHTLDESNWRVCMEKTEHMNLLGPPSA